MLSDLRQLCVHHPCGFTSCKVGLWFLPAWRRYHLTYSTNCYPFRYVDPIRARTLTAISLPTSTFLAAIPICPSRRSPSTSTPLVLRQIQHYALGNPTALLQSFVFRHLRTLSVFVCHLTLALSLSCALFAKNTGGWPPLVAGHRPLSP